MQIALLFGDRGDIVKTSIETQADNLDIKPFGHLSTFMNYVKQSNMVFDRILITTRFTDIEGVQALSVLKDFIHEYLPRASVVFIVDERDTSGIQESFNTIFDLAIYTDATTKASNLGFILDCINLKIDEIRTLYSVHQQEEVAAISESYTSTNELEEVEQSLVLTPAYKEPVINQRSQVINKRSRKANRDLLYNVSELQAQFDQVIQASYYANILEGYLSTKHITFTLADVDPNVMRYKERLHTKELWPIVYNRDMTEMVPTDSAPQAQTQLKGYAKLADILQKQGYLTIGAFYTPDYTQQPIIQVQPLGLKYQGGNQTQQGYTQQGQQTYQDLQQQQGPAQMHTFINPGVPYNQVPQPNTKGQQAPYNQAPYNQAPKTNYKQKKSLRSRLRL